jgi:hypothetical protein
MDREHWAVRGKSMRGGSGEKPSKEFVYNLLGNVPCTNALYLPQRTEGAQPSTTNPPPPHPPPYLAPDPTYTSQVQPQMFYSECGIKEYRVHGNLPR